VRRGKSSKGSARAWFDDETLAHIKQTPRPVTPRWVGNDGEEMEGLDLGEAVEDVEMDEEEIEVMREAILPRRGRNSRRATGQQAELRHFRRKMVDGKEVTHGLSPVYQALAVMEHVEMECETADKGTQYEYDWK
jgi:thiamine biosynthesis protein ThiC